MSDFWLPELSEKQLRLFNMGIEADSREHHPNAPAAILVSGARYSGKSIGAQNRILRHLWDTPAARAVIVSKTIKSMTDAGGFRDIIELEAPKWIESGIGFEFTTRDAQGIPGPRQDTKTRTISFKIRNRWGGESELQLASLNHDHEVEQLFKNTSWSCIWFSEFSLFKSSRVFTTAMMQLRIRHLKKWQHLFIADTNPAEEGIDHWIYKLWYQGRYEDEEDERDTTALEHKRSLRLIEFFQEDNPWLTEGETRVFRSRYRHDPGEYAREMEGKWVKGHGNLGKHFADLWVPYIHVISGERDELDTIDVLPTTQTLYGGWDIGSSSNHAAVVLEKRLVTVNGIDWSIWCALAELVSIKERMQVREFALAFQMIMRKLEERAGRKFEWVHWSDDSALNVPRNSGAGFDALEVQLATKEIVLQGVAKPEGSVRNRVKIVRRLLRERRLFVSARCKALQEMFKELEQGSTQKEYVAWNIHKHPFDALTYPILIESGNELLDEIFKPTASKAVTYVQI